MTQFKMADDSVKWLIISTLINNGKRHKMFKTQVERRA